MSNEFIIPCDSINHEIVKRLNLNHTIKVTDKYTFIVLENEKNYKRFQSYKAAVIKNNKYV